MQCLGQIDAHLLPVVRPRRCLDQQQRNPDGGEDASTAKKRDPILRPLCAGPDMVRCGRQQPVGQGKFTLVAHPHGGNVPRRPCLCVDHFLAPSLWPRVLRALEVQWGAGGKRPPAPRTVIGSTTHCSYSLA